MVPVETFFSSSLPGTPAVVGSLSNSLCRRDGRWSRLGTLGHPVEVGTFSGPVLAGIVVTILNYLYAPETARPAFALLRQTSSGDVLGQAVWKPQRGRKASRSIDGSLWFSSFLFHPSTGEGVSPLR